VNATMANYSPMTKLMMNNPKPKSKSPFHSSSWIFQSKDAKNEPTHEDTKKLVGLIKPINNYEIRCVYKINMEGYYKNVPIYRENRNKYVPNYDKVLQNKKK
jgi:hypothetical protein